MKTIFTTKGDAIMVSDEDYDRVRAFTWYLNASGYPYRTDGPKCGPRKSVLLHRFIMDAPPGSIVDHINHDKMDCRRENMRFCTNTENCRNGRKRNGRFEYKGIGKKKNRFRAWIMVNRKSIYLGSYLTAEDAARAYDEAAKKYHGEFACINGI